MSEPTKSTGNRAAGNKSAAAQLNAEKFDAWQAVGGVRGALESVLPALVFVTIYGFTLTLKWALIGAVGVSVVLILARLIARQPVTYSVSGFIGVGIGVIWALLTGRGENFFVFGILMAGVYGLAILIASLARFPVVSMALTPVWELPWKWWRGADVLKPLAREARRLSWLWFALFAVRALVQLPLWAAGEVALLGTTKIFLGLPPFLLIAWITWARLRPYRDVAREVAKAAADQASSRNATAQEAGEEEPGQQSYN
ncbi:MAG: DUF3159 domain-containing protein [Actinomycetaceae bacterium]|nr:DUF3159 domain-containing protein [Actinomycetaceae bacterium]